MQASASSFSLLFGRRDAVSDYRPSGFFWRAYVWDVLFASCVVHSDGSRDATYLERYVIESKGTTGRKFWCLWDCFRINASVDGSLAHGPEPHHGLRGSRSLPVMTYGERNLVGSADSLLTERQDEYQSHWQ